VIEFFAEALEEIRRTAEWYDAQRIGLGVLLVDEIEHAVRRFEKEPEAFPPWRGRARVRRVPLARFPHSLACLLSPRLAVVALVHPRRRPGYWAARLRKV
jgi:hypothetical protein